jgi:hypothetical protein
MAKFMTIVTTVVAAVAGLACFALLILGGMALTY